jgi:anti-sigma factor RsiW
MNCKEALPWMHEYMDGDITVLEAVELKKHFNSCAGCKAVFGKLENMEALVKTLPRVDAPSDLAERILLNIPQPKKRSVMVKWMKRHPAVAAASIFFLVMMSSFLSLWNQDKDLVVKGANMDQVVIHGDSVYVPAGHTVDGDLMVKRGKIQVDGEVKGNLIVIDGSYNLASTAHISGEVKQVDQALEWLWFEVNQIFTDIAK